MYIISLLCKMYQRDIPITPEVTLGLIFGKYYLYSSDYYNLNKKIKNMYIGEKISNYICNQLFNETNILKEKTFILSIEEIDKISSDAVYHNNKHLLYFKFIQKTINDTKNALINSSYDESE